MSLLGIDVGTTGCKAAVFSLQGEVLASSYAEYESRYPQPGRAELDAPVIWGVLKDAIRNVVTRSGNDAVQALAVSSLGEAVVPVTEDRRILSPSILNFDERGAEYLPALAARLDEQRLYQINGNTLGNHYSLTKLMWIKDHQPDLYDRTYKFFHWSAFVAYMLGGDPALDFSLANRTLLFDLDKGDWSDELLEIVRFERGKLPPTVPSGTVVGRVKDDIADELGLRKGVKIVSGAHDQCANAVGCGVIAAGKAVYGMGTFLCITPVFTERREPRIMIESGINTEHHAVPGQYVCFLYNQGGSLVKWFRDTFAATEHAQAEARGENVYPRLFAEVPATPSRVFVLPHFTTTGPPQFISDSCGLITGLRLETQRGEILKGIVEGTTFYLKELVDSLPPTGIEIEQYFAAGGGSQSDVWLQICANILGVPFTRPAITEAGALGAAIIAGVGSGVFGSYAEGVTAMVKYERTFEPDAVQHARYSDRYAKYRQLWPLIGDYLRTLAE